MTDILDLPSELIVFIFQYLDNTDVFATRLASKHLEASSLSYFGKRCFRKKGYLITTPSLDVLKSIAAHMELRRYVQHVWFNPDCYTFTDPVVSRKKTKGEVDENGMVDWDIDHWSEEDKRRLQAYNDCASDHNQLLLHRNLDKELTTAFNNLPNLVVIGMRRSEDHSPWGWTRLRDSIGEDPRVLGPVGKGPVYQASASTKLFMAIMSSVAAASVNLKRLYTDAIEVDQIRPDLVTQDMLNTACRSLLYLEINAVHTWLTPGWEKRTEPTDLVPCKKTAEYGQGLLRLFKAVPHLKELGLQIFPTLRHKQDPLPPGSSERHSDGWKVGYSHLAFDKAVSNMELRNLSRLKLEKIATSPETLRAVLRPSQACLASLKIRDLRLLPPNIENRYIERPWQTTLEFLRDSCSSLSYLLLHRIMYQGEFISFVEEYNYSASALRSRDGLGLPEPAEELAGGEFSTQYDNTVLEVRGRDEVETKLREVVDKHWYHRPALSYAMDDELWYTDTSDEEW